MTISNIPGVPDYECTCFKPKEHKYAVLIPILNEGKRILAELNRAKRYDVLKLADYIICDGNSTDGCAEPEKMKKRGVNTLLVKLGPGKQGAQLRMGIHYALERGYKGIITVDGNHKDSIEDVAGMIQKLEEGYDLIQGSRFIKGGHAIRTPLSRLIAVRCIHAPIISLTAGKHYTDTTNAFRGYSSAYLSDPKVAPLRDIFIGYELLAYLSVRANQLGYKSTEIPVTRRYPEKSKEKTPTKIHGFKGNQELLKILMKNALGQYRP